MRKLTKYVKPLFPGIGQLAYRTVSPERKKTNEVNYMISATSFQEALPKFKPRKRNPSKAWPSHGSHGTGIEFEEQEAAGSTR